VDSSLAAVIIADEQDRVVLANEAALQMFGFAGRPLTGEALGRLIPGASLCGASGHAPLSRRMVECAAVRRDGSTFFAQIWISRFPTEAGSRLAAVVFDASAEHRDREQEALRDRLMNSRVVLGAVWHELSNLTAAIGALWANLNRILPQQPEVRTLGTLAGGLRELLSEDLGRPADTATAAIDLRAVLEELRIIIEPGLREVGVSLEWEVASGLPLVRGTHHGILQVLLNLAQNARRALQGRSGGRFGISADLDGSRLRVRCWNNGPPIPDPARLFTPFQEGADGHGLGLYISRAIVRGFGGDLRYAPAADACCFDLHLAAVQEKSLAARAGFVA
jgi:two-component system sensor kinase FixL